MKNIIKYVFFIVGAIIVFSSCSHDEISIPEMKMLIGEGPSMDDCLININKDGTVEYFSFEVNTYNFSTKEIEGDIYEKKTIRLSNKNKAIVNEYIQGMLVNEPKEENQGSDFIKIRAFVEGETYHSVYHDLGITWKWWYDENLAKLCYKLVDIAPLKVGGKMNPLEVPED